MKLFLSLLILLPACAQATPSNAPFDASLVDSNSTDDSSNADADLGTSGMCHSCLKNSDCNDGMVCALIGGQLACVTRCENSFDCSDGFHCSDSEPSVCQPTDNYCCIDEDGDNYGSGISCEGLDCNDSNDQIHPSMDDICNGVNDDCDPASSDGSGEETPVATLNEGVCTGAKKTCEGSTGWKDPDFSTIPNYEATEISCDGLDNNCDGSADNGLNAPPANKVQGVCSGSEKICTGITGWQEPNYSAIPYYEADEVSCDNRDNDWMVQLMKTILAEEIHATQRSSVFAKPA